MYHPTNELLKIMITEGVYLSQHVTFTQLWPNADSPSDPPLGQHWVRILCFVQLNWHKIHTGYEFKLFSTSLLHI